MRLIPFFIFTAAVAFMLGRGSRRGRGTPSASTLFISRVENLDTGEIVEGEILVVTLQEGQRVHATVKPLSKHNNPAKVEPGSVSWQTSDPTVATVEQDATDELSAVITRRGEGEALITIKADGDLGEGVNPITGVGTVSCPAPGAASFSIEFGVPEDVPEESTTEASSETAT
jgi:hypothetical protein